MDQILTQSLGFNLSKYPDTEGFDLQAGQTWVYPTNYSIRDYQFNIVQKALLNNTLVSLPTGLGKTFIAAVVMYNFFRWYPMGKVVFMAPTRPLVKQQIDACYDITAIPKEVTAELTGTKLATSRADIWKQKRVFFVTPQILQNDLETLQDLGKKIKCLVFDEAHRAKGHHAYCEVIRKLMGQNKFFRVLALSATPGSTINDVLEVVQNLLISHLEFRTEESLDVQPYVYRRNLTTVVVPLGDKLQSVRDEYLQILEYYTKTLMKYKVIQGNCGNLTKGKIFMTMKEFQKNRTSNSPNYAEIMKSLNICVTLYHAYELLTRHGLRSFLSFFTEHIDKPLLRGSTQLIQIVNDVREYLGPEPNIETLPDGSNPDIPKTIKFGHPKFYKLRDILLSHFLEADDSSRVIVFFEYRNSVTEAYGLLVQARPVLKPRIFLGQGHGITQRLQLNVVKSFRDGLCNVLLSTCIGEEGLDVGNVDLIICFDISNKSPIRMVQRMGRTGRKKEGNIIVLVTEGKEQQVLKDCLMHKNNIVHHVLSSKELAKGLNSCSPRLVPVDVSPKCEKMYITVQKPTLKKNSSLKDMFRSASGSSSEPNFSPDLELVEIEERIPKIEMLWNKGNPLEQSGGNRAAANIFNKNIERQRRLQPIRQIKHSKSSEAFVELLQLVDSKRFNLPVTQIGTMSQLSQSRNLRQGDIRNMFTKLQSNFDIPTTQSQSAKCSATPSNSTEDNYYSESKELFAEISNYLSIQLQNSPKKCRHCPDTFECTLYNSDIPNVEISWIQIDETIFDTITLKDIKSFTNSLDPRYTEFDLDDLVDSDLLAMHTGNDIFSDIQVTQLEEIARKMPGNAEISLEQVEEAILEKNEDADVTFGNKSCVYEAPKNLELLISKYGTSIIEIEVPEVRNRDEKVTEASKSNTVGVNKQELLNFFKLESLPEIFKGEIGTSSDETIIYSPDIIDATFASDKEKNCFSNKNEASDEELQMSPVLKGFHIPSRLRRGASANEITLPNPNRPNLHKLNVPSVTVRNRNIETPSKFTMNATKISSTPLTTKATTSKIEVEKEVHKSYSDRTGNYTSHVESPKKSQDKVDIDVDSICDLSVFGISPIKSKTTVSSVSKDAMKTQVDKFSPKDFNIDDFCDLSSFGINSRQTQTKNKKEKISVQMNRTPSKSNTAAPASKGQSQSQVPITQLLSLINKDECTPSVSFLQEPTEIQKNIEENFDSRKDCGDNVPSINLVKKPTKILKDTVNGENVNSYNGTSKWLMKKKSDLNKTTRPTSILDSPVHKPKPKKNLNRLFDKLSSSSTPDSEDEFEQKPSSPVFKRPRLATSQSARKSKKQNPKPVTKKKAKNMFIEEEAEVSEDENVFMSEDEEDGDRSMYEASFVADDTQHMDTQMHARYLQSLRSPVKTGNFKITHRPKLNIIDVYSQEVDHEDDTYLDDSFVVTDEVDSTLHELSELEILELKLKEQRKIKRQNSDDDGRSSKRRRIIPVSDDSD